MGPRHIRIKGPYISWFEQLPLEDRAAEVQGRYDDFKEQIGRNNVRRRER